MVNGFGNTSRYNIIDLAGKYRPYFPAKQYSGSHIPLQVPDDALD